ncbi:hypothetical protein ACP4OV_006011 [Aristida adscensionis]
MPMENSPFTFKLLAPPPGFGPPPLLPLLPPADAPPTPGHTTPAPTLPGAMDYYAMDLPPPACNKLPAAAAAAAVDADIKHGHAVEAPAATVPLAAPPTPVSHGDATPYDADIDASLRATEKDPGERPSPEYLDTTQRGRMDPTARAALVLWIIEFTRHFALGRAALHRAVAYADRLLSARPLPDDGGDCVPQLRLLAAVAATTAAKYEDRAAAAKLSPRLIASGCGFPSSQEVVAAELAMVAALGYRLGGPTADTFVDHFTRHGRRHGEDADGDLELLRHTVHVLADSSLFDHRCLKLLPSAVAAAAILLAMMVLKPSYDDEQARRWSREIEEMTGYKPVDVKDGMDAMYARLPNCYPRFVISPLFFTEDP